MPISNERLTGALTASFKFTDYLDLSYRMGLDTYTNDAYTYIAPGVAVAQSASELEMSDIMMQKLISMGYSIQNWNASVEQYAQYGIENAKDRRIYSIPVWWDWTK